MRRAPCQAFFLWSSAPAPSAAAGTILRQVRRNDKRALRGRAMRPLRRCETRGRIRPPSPGNAAEAEAHRQRQRREIPALIVETESQVLEEVTAKAGVEHGGRVEAALVQGNLADRADAAERVQLERAARIPAKADADGGSGSFGVEVLAGEAAEIEFARVISQLADDVEVLAERVDVTDAEARRDQVELVVDDCLGQRTADRRAYVDNGAVECARHVEVRGQRERACDRNAVAVPRFERDRL